MKEAATELTLERVQPLQAVIDDLEAHQRKVIFTMARAASARRPSLPPSPWAWPAAVIAST